MLVEVSHVVEHGMVTYKGLPAPLASEVPIVEHLRGLVQLPGAGFRFFAVPVKVKGMGTFPVRAFGIAEEPA
jgi:kynurenine formamidase